MPAYDYGQKAPLNNVSQNDRTLLAKSIACSFMALAATKEQLHFGKGGLLQPKVASGRSPGDFANGIRSFFETGGFLNSRVNPNTRRIMSLRRCRQSLCLSPGRCLKTRLTLCAVGHRANA